MVSGLLLEVDKCCLLPFLATQIPPLTAATRLASRLVIESFALAVAIILVPIRVLGAVVRSFGCNCGSRRLVLVDRLRRSGEGIGSVCHLAIQTFIGMVSINCESLKVSDNLLELHYNAESGMEPMFYRADHDDRLRLHFLTLVPEYCIRR